MPTESLWSMKYCSPDKVHYVSKSLNHLSHYINRYINRLDDTICSKLLNNINDSYITVGNETKSYEEFIGLCKQTGSYITKFTNAKTDISDRAF